MPLFQKLILAPKPPSSSSNPQSHYGLITDRSAHFMYQMSLTYIKSSKIHGKGLFAKQPITAGTILGYLKGKPTKQDGMYVLWLDQKNGFEVSCDLKFINHSDEPNACYFDDKSVVALRDIEAHEEITHNYESAW